MSGSPQLRAEHEVEVRAAAESVFRLLADIGDWPRVFRPFVHLAHLSDTRIGMWATFDDTVEHWVTSHEIDVAGLRIDFVPERTHPPLTSMTRSWTVDPLADDRCLLGLTHRYQIADPTAGDAVAASFDDVANRELAAVKAAVEQRPDVLLVLHDVVDVAGSAAEVYEVLYDVGRWPDRMAHVAKVDVRHDEGDTQVVVVDTFEKDGGVLTTKTARVGFPAHEIAYKHLLLPPLGMSHHVNWRIEPTVTGASITSRQVVVLDAAGAQDVLGLDIARAREFATRELTTKVRLLLEGARTHVESRR